MPPKLQHGAREKPGTKLNLRSSQLTRRGENDLVNVVRNKRQKTSNKTTSQLTKVINALSNNHQPQLPPPSQPQPPSSLPTESALMQPHIQPIIESTIEQQLQQLREQIQRERDKNMPLHLQVQQLLNENSRLQQNCDRFQDNLIMINSSKPQKRFHNQISEAHDLNEEIQFQPINNYLPRNRVNDNKVLEFSKIKPPSFTGNLMKDEYNYTTWQSNAKSYLNSINASEVDKVTALKIHITGVAGQFLNAEKLNITKMDDIFAILAPAFKSSQRADQLFEIRQDSKETCRELYIRACLAEAKHAGVAAHNSECFNNNESHNESKER